MVDIYNVPNGYLVKHEYEIINKIAQGGSGAVYMAQKGPLKTKYAVKFVDLRKNKKDRNNYIQEILLMKDINHPNISKIIDHEDHDDYFIAVFLYVNGPTLAEKLKVEGPLPEQEVLNIAITLCDIFIYLHGTNETDPIVYLDLKPENIMLENGIPKIIDFGNAKKLPGHRPIKLKVNENKGTKGFAAPEQYHVGNLVDIRTDIYGFGATLFNLLTGEKGSIKTDGLHPASYVSVSEGMDYIVAHCTYIDPGRRYQTFSDLKKDLQNIGHFNATYENSLKKKLYLFYGAGIVAIFCAFMIFLSFGIIQTNINNTYQEHFDAGQRYEQLNQKEKAEKEYLLAIQSDATQSKVYNRLLNMMLPEKQLAVSSKSVDQTKKAIDIFKNNTAVEDVVKNPKFAFRLAQECISVNDPIYSQYAHNILTQLKTSNAYKNGSLNKEMIDGMYLISSNKALVNGDENYTVSLLDKLYQSTKKSKLNDSQKCNNYYIILVMGNTYSKQNMQTLMHKTSASLNGLIYRNANNKHFTFNKTISFYELMANYYATMAINGNHRAINQGDYWYEQLEKQKVSLDASSNITKGNFYRAAKQYNKAKSAYKAALASDDENLEALIPLTQTCIEEQKNAKSKNYAEAHNYYDRINDVLSANPDQPTAILSQLNSLKTQFQTIK